ncbi:MAG: HEAT repeat domain-containing protein [Promethearchaeota archaeon]
MNRDLKELINTVEEETKSRAELEATINSLKEETNRLKFTIKEQQLLIEEQGDQISFAQSDIPSEINILKEMITSQRKDLIKRDENIEKLNDKIDELTSQMVKAQQGSVEEQNDDLFEAQELILKLSEESEEYRKYIEDLKNQIEQMQSQKVDYERTNHAKTEVSEELVNIKRLNFQLMEQNGLLRVEIESLKAKMEGETSKELELANKKIIDLTSELEALKIQLQEKAAKANSEELEFANKQIETLTSKIKDYDAQLKFLQKELEKTMEPTTISTEEALKFAEMREQYDNTKSELIKFQKENEVLQNKISELENYNIELDNVEAIPHSVAYDIPEQFQISLFKKMYKFLDENNKNRVINALIKDLNNKNNDIRRSAIKLLSEIKDKKVYDTFFELIHDKDWLIRYNLIKALKKFNVESEEFKSLLIKLSKDADVDVRELAVKILNEISK